MLSVAAFQIRKLPGASQQGWTPKPGRIFSRDWIRNLSILSVMPLPFYPCYPNCWSMGLIKLIWYTQGSSQGSSFQLFPPSFTWIFKMKLMWLLVMRFSSSFLAPLSGYFIEEDVHMVTTIFDFVLVEVKLSNLKKNM